jgi:hypothetical protein
VTRASSNTTDQRRADYAQLLRQVPQVSQLSLLNAQGREQLRMTRQTVTLDSNADFSRDVRLTETLSRGTSFAPAYLRGERPFTSIALSHADGSITVAEIDLDFLSEFLIDAQVGKVAFAYVTDAKGRRAGRLLDRARGRQESVEAAAGRRPSASPAAWRRRRAPMPRATPC